MAAKGEARAKISLDFSSWESACKSVQSLASATLKAVVTMGAGIAAAATAGLAAFSASQRVCRINNMHQHCYFYADS